MLNYVQFVLLTYGLEFCISDSLLILKICRNLDLTKVSVFRRVYKARELVIIRCSEFVFDCNLYVCVCVCVCGHFLCFLSILCLLKFYVLSDRRPTFPTKNHSCTSEKYFQYLKNVSNYNYNVPYMTSILTVFRNSMIRPWQISKRFYF